MTLKEFYTKITETVEDTELVEFAKAAIEKINAANEKKRNTPSKVQKENEPLIEKIMTEVLTITPITASDVASAIDVSVQKASGVLRTLVKADKIVQTEAKVPKKGVVKLYALKAD